MENYGEIVDSLTKLTAGKIERKKNNTKITWNEEANTAFQTLKQQLAQKVTLKFPDFTKSFFLTTDAPNNAIGGILQQKDGYRHG